ncbi:GNAT family N-acetyltransferase [Bacillus sp. DX4.1]|uniref:GNAT family N-acetyltransferase n=1 Tax=Bacillus sp. DX4.1 TaxID=3055867 RepID=UPI0025A2E3CA|nr:GNAT family N-acetyltransferase [Bacillus sp. DX4.1]MDM5188667.1 GNAT family N-acetyltransferase [Bacillus sp. DX4.1]
MVAEDEGRVIGMIGLYTGILYNKDETYARIIALIVDNHSRNKGIGKQLIQEAERWEIHKGANSIGLNRGNRSKRKDAHEFYKGMGCEEKSTGFAKILL